MIAARIIFCMIGIVLLSYLPWSLFVVCVGIYALFISRPYEIIVWGLFVDGLFGVYHGVPFLATFLFSFIFLVTELLSNYSIWYGKSTYFKKY
jgi:hypothetical protein